MMITRRGGGWNRRARCIVYSRSNRNVGIVRVSELMIGGVYL